jgi:hypothetical protein
MPRTFPEFPATPRIPEGPSADSAFRLHNAEEHREKCEAEAEALKLEKHGGHHKNRQLLALMAQRSADRRGSTLPHTRRGDATKS